MAKHVEISLEAAVVDAASLFVRVERNQDTITVLHFGEPVAVISPAPVAETLADLHRALMENPLTDEQHLDVMETRRLLGL